MRTHRASALVVLGVCAAVRPIEAAEVTVLAAGAVEAALRDTLPAFEQDAGLRVKVTYGAVGALRDRVEAGEPADVIVVTPAIIEQLSARGLVRAATKLDLGQVGGGIAVRKGAPRPAVGTAGELRQALLAAERVYYADPATATAGAWLMTVIDRLGIGDAVRAKGHSAPGGRAAMQLLGKDEGRAIGLTQVSEIVAVDTVTLVGPYPGDLQRMTTYSAVVPARAQLTPAVQAFLAFLASPRLKARLVAGGYEAAR